jgi:hypothetical protein
MRKRVTVTQEIKTGRNQQFKDNYNGQTMSRSKFVQKIINNDNNYQEK